MTKKFVLYGIFLLLLAGACKEKYTPKTNYPYTGYLVVQGVIAADGGVTTVNLTRTTALDSSYYRAETGALLSVEDENSQSYPLYESGPGVYNAVGIPVQSGARYRLRIQTADTRTYLSAFTRALLTPLVDSVSWGEKNDGIQIYVTTHGPAADTGYYRWHFDETWKYNANYFSSLVYDPGSPYAVHNFRPRTGDEQVFTCWKSDTSSAILLGSTAKLASNVLSLQPVTFIPYSEDYNKLYLRYSINVYMESLSGDEYAWYDKLRKNTESLGSIFDAQPSELTGNIQSLTDPTETVVGWVGCHTVTQKRIFIGRFQLPSHPVLSKGFGDCSLDTIKFGPEGDPHIQTVYSDGRFELPTGFWSLPGAADPLGIIGSSVRCTDCRVLGGVTTQPSFWVE